MLKNNFFRELNKNSNDGGCNLKDLRDVQYLTINNSKLKNLQNILLTK